jgi:parallel beta helix pectate lyase-like protein
MVDSTQKGLPMNVSMKIAGLLCAATVFASAGPTHAGDVKLLKQPSVFPLVINQGGSYRLKSNIVVPDANTTAISITADDVTLDLNGYAIKGPTVCSGSPIVSCTPTGTGIGIDASADGVTVQNGTVRGMGSYGIRLSGWNGVVDRMHVRSNGSIGVDFINGVCRVTDNIVTENGNAGIYLSDMCIARGNVVRSNAGDGIDADLDTLVTGNVIVRNNTGIAKTQDGVVIGNMIGRNRGGGIDGNGFGTVSDNTVFENTGADGIAWAQGVVSNNTVLGNASDGIVTNGLLTGNDSEDNGFSGIGGGPTSGYSNNVSNNNNGGNANPQASGIAIGGNVCGGDATCP